MTLQSYSWAYMCRKTWSERIHTPQCSWQQSAIAKACVCVCVCVCVHLVTQSCLTLCNHMDCRPPGSFVNEDSPGKNTGVGYHALLQGTFPTQGFNPGTAGRFLTIWATTEAPAEKWKPPKCPSTEKWMKKMWYIYVMEYYSAIKKNEIMLHAATGMDQERVILSEVNQTRRRRNIWHSLYMESKKKRYKWTYLQNRKRLRLRKWTYGCQGSGRRGSKYFGKVMYAVLEVSLQTDGFPHESLQYVHSTQWNRYIGYPLGIHFYFILL